jgi:hypothetical protein
MKTMLCFCAAMLAAIAANADGSANGFTVSPVASSNITYDDNIYLAPDNAASAYISRTDAGLNSEYKKGATDITADYDAAALVYSRDQSADNAIHHDIKLGLATQLLKGTTVSFSEEYLATTDRENEEFTGIIRREQNEARIDAQSLLGGNLLLLLDGKNSYHAYSTANAYDSDRAMTGFGGGIGYAMDAVMLHANWEYSRLGYKGGDEDDATINAFMAGARGEICGMEFQTEAGIEKRSYSTDVADAASAYDTGIGNAKLVWRQNEYSTITMSLYRQNKESQLYQNNRFFTATGGEFAWNAGFATIGLRTGIGFEAVLYPETNQSDLIKRNDQITRFNIGLDYHLSKGVTASADFAHAERSSNETDSLYSANSVSLGLRAAL